MNGIELFLAVVVAAWGLFLLASTVRLVIARTPDESESARRVLVAAVIAGFIIGIAPHVAKWITGFGAYTYEKDGELYYSRVDPNIVCNGKPDSPSITDLVDSGKAFSPEISGTIDKLVNGITLFGGLVVSVGIVWGGIKMQMRRRRKLSGRYRGVAIFHALCPPR